MRYRDSPVSNVERGWREVPAPDVWLFNDLAHSIAL
jgi:hypothetical protein